MKKLLCVFLLALALFSISCGPIAVKPTYPINATPSATDQPVLAIPPTSLPVAANTSVPDSGMGEICPGITLGLPATNISLGTLVLVDHDRNDLIFFDLQTGNRTSVASAGERTYSYAVSPNGKWLAYELQDSSSKKEELIIVTAKGEKSARFPWKDEWRNIAYWLDDQRLIIKLMPVGYKPFVFLILNPFTNEQQTLIPDFSGIYPMESPPDWREAGPVIYDPSLQRAVFAGINNVYVVWDVPMKKPLTTLRALSFINFPTKAPQWSPDSNEVLIATSNASPFDFVNDELFSIDQSGSVTKLTNFADVSYSIGITRYSWSPDGSYVAMFFVEVPSGYSGEQLAIIDTANHKINHYCIQGDITLQGFRKNERGFYDDVVYAGVIWSPNGSQIVVENRIAENLSNIILVDITKNLAFQIIDNENVQPIGWMVTEP
jgi:Tol biopolymer transport system component